MSNSVPYFRRGLRKVGGWLHPYSAKYIMALSEAQYLIGERGSVGEIGIHHGKLFILMAALTCASEHAWGIDVFDDQHMNVDRSGQGNKKIFLENMERWLPQFKDFHIIQKLSFDVQPFELLEACGRSRLVSIDGGHTAECVINDLSLVEAVLTQRGVVVLDDYFNAYWPEVSDGVQEYLRSGRSTLAPFAITPNKVYLTPEGSVSLYRKEMRASQAYHYEKTSKLLGCEVDIFGLLDFTFSSKKRFIEYVKSTPMAPYAKAVKAKLGL